MAASPFRRLFGLPPERKEERVGLEDDADVARLGLRKLDEEEREDTERRIRAAEKAVQVLQEYEAENHRRKS
jgi:arginase family enzyme